MRTRDYEEETQKCAVVRKRWFRVAFIGPGTTTLTLICLGVKKQKCPHLCFMDRMDGRWASLGRGNPGRPESIGNKLGLGSDGPRI